MKGLASSKAAVAGPAAYGLLRGDNIITMEEGTGGRGMDGGHQTSHYCYYNILTAHRGSS